MKPLIVGCPSRDEMGMVLSVVTLSRVGDYLDRPVEFITGVGSNIPRARNAVMQGIRREHGVQDHWVLWWDSDIWLTTDQAPAVAEMIRFSEQHGMATTIDYRINTGEHVLMKRMEDGKVHRFTDKGIESLPNWAPIDATGFGLCYCPVESDYVFHADALGEDIHYWQDHPNLELRFAKNVRVRHAKTVML